MSKGTTQRFTALGRLGNAPEVVETKGDLSVVRFNVATTDRIKRKGSENWEDETTWHHVTAFGQLAEFAKTYLKKGDTIYVEAKLRTNEWEDKEGNKRYGIDIIATELQQAGRIGRPDGAGVPDGEKNKEDDPLKDVQ